MVYNIIHRHDKGIGGAETLVRNLFENYWTQENKYQLIGICNKKETQKNFSGWGVKNIYSIDALLKTIQWFKRLNNDDIVHVHLFPTLFYVAFAKAIIKNKVKIIYTEHSTKNKRRNNIFGQLLDAWIYRRYNMIIAISNGVRNQLIDHLLFSRSEIKVVYNGILLENYSTKKKVVKNQNRATFKIATIGRLEKVKNHESILDAIKILVTKRKDFTYHIVGNGSLEKTLKRKVKDNFLDDYVVFEGFHRNIKEEIKNYDLVVAYSLWEGFGLSVVECMSMGVPVIISDVPGLNEVVPDHYPFKLPLHQSEKLATMMNDGMEKGFEYIKTLKKFSCRFDLEKTADSYQSIYSNL